VHFDSEHSVVGSTTSFFVVPRAPTPDCPESSTHFRAEDDRDRPRRRGRYQVPTPRHAPSLAMRPGRRNETAAWHRRVVQYRPSNAPCLINTGTGPAWGTLDLLSPSQSPRALLPCHYGRCMVIKPDGRHTHTSPHTSPRRRIPRDQEHDPGRQLIGCVSCTPPTATRPDICAHTSTPASPGRCSPHHRLSSAITKTAQGWHAEIYPRAER
jgi:hypothetical protein